MRTVRPKYFVMENVPNLLTTEHGYFKKEVFELLNLLDMVLMQEYCVQLTMVFLKIEIEHSLSEIA